MTMNEPIQWMGLYPEEMKRALADLGEKPFRAGQVFSWLHKGARFSEMTNLSLALREKRLFGGGHGRFGPGIRLGRA